MTTEERCICGHVYHRHTRQGEETACRHCPCPRYQAPVTEVFIDPEPTNPHQCRAWFRELIGGPRPAMQVFYCELPLGHADHGRPAHTDAAHMDWIDETPGAGRATAEASK